MKKEGKLYLVLLITVFLTLFLLNSVNAAVNNSTSPSTSIDKTGFDKADQCLQDQIETRGYSSMTVEELAFSLLALGYDNQQQSDIKKELEAKKDSNSCWPTSSCNVKDTALVLLAYNFIDEDTEKIESWLLNQTMASSGLVWFLQIDNPSNEVMQCTISYDGNDKKITINADKTITGSAGNCLVPAYNNYWLEVKSSCYEKEIDISCDKDFFTSTLYKRTSSSTYYISAQTNSASPDGQTTEKVESRCFKQGSSCNYEASLWASIALQKTGQEVERFLPYLIASASDNERFMPSAFLYILTNFDEYFTDLTNKQNKNGYWQATSSDASRRYYDTSIALMALSGKSSGQADSAISYLLSPNVQGENGCWANSIRDTSFILFSANPKNPAGGLAPRSRCTDFSSDGYSCLSQRECDSINGSILTNFYCVANICCSKSPKQETCSDKSGTICSSSEECSGDLEIASDSSRCCVDGECTPKPDPVLVDCITEGNSCRDQCLNSEEEVELDGCDSLEVCCQESYNPVVEKSYWWLWLLAILIILLILAIIYRNQLKIWMFKIKNKFSKSPAPQQTRPFPPSYPPTQQSNQPRRIVPGTPAGTPPRPPFARPAPRPFPKDKELDETLKKLKDMSN